MMRRKQLQHFVSKDKNGIYSNNRKMFPISGTDRMAYAFVNVEMLSAKYN